MKIRLAVSLFAALAFGACGGESHDHDHDAGQESHDEGHEHGPHGGHVLEIGDHVAHLEVVHDDAAGTLTLYVLGEDGKSALSIAKPPKIKIATADGPKVLEGVPEGGDHSVYVVEDAALRGHEPRGRVAIEIEGKSYSPDIAHDH